jgi:hypothetical protein
MFDAPQAWRCFGTPFVPDAVRVAPAESAVIPSHSDRSAARSHAHPGLDPGEHGERG